MFDPGIAFVVGWYHRSSEPERQVSGSVREERSK